jgi:hypothetical protein
MVHEAKYNGGHTQKAILVATRLRQFWSDTQTMIKIIISKELVSSTMRHNLWVLQLKSLIHNRLISTSLTTVAKPMSAQQVQGHLFNYCPSA